MSELAYRYQEKGIYTKTEGNLTTLFFGSEPATVYAFPGTNAPGAFEATTADESLTPRQKELAKPDTAAVAAMADLADQSPTPRQKELAKPDTVDMAVEPLESYDQLRALLDFFAAQGSQRDVCLMTFGFCTGLRISDLLNLKIGDIVESVSPMVFKRAIDIHEQKTGKRTVGHLDDMLITPAMQEAFSRYMTTKPADDTGTDRYLFTTIRTHGRKPMNISTIQKAMIPAFATVCPHLHCSTHTMRKTFVSIIHTFASQATMTGAGLNPATACQIALRHASASTTLAYMGTMKSGMLSLRKAVSDFVQGKTKIRSLKSEYTWETIDD